MKFKHVMNCKATMKKKKSYEFDFSEEDIEKGSKATYDNPHRFRPDKSLALYEMYTDKNGKLCVTSYISFDSFEEVIEE